MNDAPSNPDAPAAGQRVLLMYAVLENADGSVEHVSRTDFDALTYESLYRTLGQVKAGVEEAIAKVASKGRTPSEAAGLLGAAEKHAKELRRQGASRDRLPFPRG